MGEEIGKNYNTPCALAYSLTVKTRFCYEIMSEPHMIGIG